MGKEKLNNRDWTLILLVGFGYFVDIYDLLLFSVVRTVSLEEIGVSSGQAITTNGIKLIEVTVWGMLIGSYFWGIIADKIGRKTSLIFSILTYSIGNILCSSVESLPAYYLFRFITGVGIAGEFGAGLTLVSENISAENRSKSTTIIGAIGMLGAITAAIVGKFLYWRYSYMFGTLLGIGLLISRLQVSESFFLHSVSKNRGNIIKLLRTPASLKKYILGILIGLNVFFIIGAYVSLSPEIGKSYNLTISASTAVIVCYSSICFFDIIAGIMSIVLRSRKKVIAIFLAIQLIGALVFYLVPCYTTVGYYLKLIFVCSGVGMWAVLNTYITELFGTEIRGTVAVTTPNVIRWLFTITSSILLYIRPYFNVVEAITIISVSSIIISFIALSFLSDRFQNNTNFLEFKN